MHRGVLYCRLFVVGCRFDLFDCCRAPAPRANHNICLFLFPPRTLSDRRLLRLIACLQTGRQMQTNQITWTHSRSQKRKFPVYETEVLFKAIEWDLLARSCAVASRSGETSSLSKRERERDFETSCARSSECALVKVIVIATILKRERERDSPALSLARS